MGAVGTTLHFGLLGLYIYVSYLLHVANKSYPGAEQHPVIKTLNQFSTRYLTNWTFAMQMVYFLISSLSHIIGTVGATRLKAKVQNVADYIFISIATPMAFVVSLVFWGWYAVDRELVFPKELDLVIPFWVNQVIHTVNTLCTFVDMAITNHRVPSWKSSSVGLLTYLLAYAICLFGTYFQTGIWLYPFLKGMSWAIRGIFAVITIGLAFVMLWITRTTHSLIWGNVRAGGADKRKGTRQKKA